MLEPKSAESQASCPILAAFLRLGPFVTGPPGGHTWASRWPAVWVLLRVPAALRPLWELDQGLCPSVGHAVAAALPAQCPAVLTGRVSAGVG